MDLERFLEDARGDVAGIIKTFLGCSPSEPCIQQARAASPIRYVDPTDGAIYLGNSTEEIIPLEQARLMSEALSRAGVPTQLFETPGRLHGLGAVHNEKGFSPAAAFLGEWLRVDMGVSVAPGSGSDRGSGSRPSVGPRPDRPQGQIREADRDRTWLVVLVAAALGIAAASLVVMTALLRRVRELTRRPDDRKMPPVGADDDPSERRLIGSRAEPPA
jgi:acetyl esterase/lipase